MGWKNAEKSTVGKDWGEAPTLVEGIPARITLPFPPVRRPFGRWTRAVSAERRWRWRRTRRGTRRWRSVPPIERSGMRWRSANGERVFRRRSGRPGRTDVYTSKRIGYSLGPCLLKRLLN
jgi:hypothetical protein